LPEENQMSNRNQQVEQSLTSRIDVVGLWLAPFGLRILLAWEFFESGLEKLQGANWFADLGDKFPMPFSLLSSNTNWTMATWFELVGSFALLLGLGTRFVALSLWVLTIVATYTIHWPSDWSSLSELWQGYAISNDGYGNYKLPLIYLVMLLPLILNGSGRLSLDHLIDVLRDSASKSSAGPSVWGLVLLTLGVTVSLLLPWVGGTLAGIAAILLVFPRRPGSVHMPLSKS
jgi:putative oxidoreductase